MTRKGKAAKTFTENHRQHIEARCIECGRLGVLTEGARVYPDRPELRERMFYVCACGARVGCHVGSAIPMGLPCGPKTATARERAHRTLDPLWRAKEAAGVRRHRARNQVYTWLAGELGIARADCHISHFDEATCRLVIELCNNAAAAGPWAKSG